MRVAIYGLMGHAGRFELPLDHLDVEDLSPGEEFVFNGRVYEIRSVAEEGDDNFLLNVSLVMNHARA